MELSTGGKAFRLAIKVSHDSHNEAVAPPHLLQALYRVGTVSGPTDDPRKSMEVLLEEAMALTGADCGAVMLWNPDSGLLETEVFRGPPPAAPFPSLKMGEGRIGWAVLHAKPVRGPVPADPRCPPCPDSSLSQLIIPIPDGDRSIGALVLERASPVAFSPAHQSDCGRLAAEAARVAHVAWRIQHLTKKAGQLEAVLTAGQTLPARLDLPVILETIARAALPLSDGRMAAILLLSDDGSSLRPRAVVLRDGGKSDHPDLALGETSAGIAVRRGRQVEVTDLFRTEENRSLLAMAQREKLVSLLCTPIVFEGRSLGVLNLYTDRSHRFPNDGKRIVEAMAGFGALAIHNARLYARVMKSEETLRQSEKLSILGLLAAELAHEIRNPLTVLKLLFQSLNLSFEEGDPRHRDTEIIDEKLNQLEETIGKILGFSRPPAEVFAPVDMAEMIRDTLLLVRHKLAQSGVELRFLPPAEKVVVEGNKSQLQQALLNLILNSLQAMDTGGEMTLSARIESFSEGETAVLEITDTGPGIPPGLRDRVFERFLTGRQDGTGLGLPIVKRIVESHRGTLDLVRTGETGTTFRILLPRAG